ncbi:MAG: hypothetical protein VXY06_01330 [Bacteroidota bacterium]|nr:hypothetical protein [Bacteroidota bacterium]MEE3037388.1 hypothetical protein [Bacteroidota bacterium]
MSSTTVIDFSEGPSSIEVKIDEKHTAISFYVLRIGILSASAILQDKSSDF